jgi:hypothetical protein
MVAAREGSANLIYLADVLRERGIFRVRHAHGSSPSTRGHVAAMLVTACLIGLGWVAAQGLDDSDRCPVPRDFTCIR